MRYTHEWITGEEILESAENSTSLPTGKAVCVGRNYVAHAVELGNPVPDEPVLFIKPPSSLVHCQTPLALKSRFSPIHYEAELVVLIGNRLTEASEAEALDAIIGVGIALDLTRRELQSEMKQRKLPWELAKGFDGSCVVSPFVPFTHQSLESTCYSLRINGQLKQQGDTALMVTPVLALVAHISQTFTLEPGDIVLTGTPEGVGQLHDGDTLELALEQQILTARCQCRSV